MAISSDCDLNIIEMNMYPLPSLSWVGGDDHGIDRIEQEV
jgi:hypothetical protein